MNFDTRKTVAPRLLTSALTIAALALSSCASNAQTTAAQPVAAKVATITPAQWFKSQPKPIYKPGNTMPRLTRYGWSLGLDANVALTEDWHYALQLPTYLSDDDRVLERLKDPNDEVFKIVALTNSNPKKYPLATIISRSEPADQVPAAFLHDAAGKLINDQQIYSPIAPQVAYDKMAEMRARPLRELRKKVPINMILNGGEYGLGVPGFMRDLAAKDPKAAAAQAKSGLDWISFISRAKKREMDTIADAVRKAVPDRNLYIYYATGAGDRNRYGSWREWGMDPEDSLEGSDLASTEYYYKHFNSGYLPDGQGNDLLTRALNSVGFQIAHNKKNYYDWVTSGYVDGAIEDALWNSAPDAAATAATPTKNSEERTLSNGNVAALVDPNASELSPMNLYTGFLKCLFTTGTLGANAGYYAFPTGGFDASFSADKPRQWALQMARLSHVQALFSYVEDDLRKGDLLKGDGQHRWTRDQPSYEFSSSEPNVRIVARKTVTNTAVAKKTVASKAAVKKPVAKKTVATKSTRWLVTVWASDGLTRPVKTTIPELGELTLLARPEGSVYRVTLQDGKPQLEWLDPDGMTPTANGFKPQKVTTEQIKAAWKAPDQPVQENLQLHFDAAQGITKDAANAVLSWKPGGALADWTLQAPPKDGNALWVADAVNGLPAIRLDGKRLGLVTQLLTDKGAIAPGTVTIFGVYSSTVPQAFPYQNGGNNGLLNSNTGLTFTNGPLAERQTWQMSMQQRNLAKSPPYLALGGPIFENGELYNQFTFSGDIAELLVYNGVLSAAQQAQTRLYLQAKYRL